MSEDRFPTERARGWHAAAALLLLLVVALLQARPLPIDPTAGIQRGAEAEVTVPLFGLWSLWWPGEALAGASGTGLWDAPIFHPTSGAFARSEPMLLPGLAAAPLWWTGVRPAVIYGLVLVAILVLNGWFAVRLCRALGENWWVAACAGAMAVALPYTTLNLGILQILGFFGVLWCLEGAVRFSRDGSWRSAAWAALGLCVQAGLSVQLTAMSLPFLIGALGLALHSRGWQRRELLRLGACVGVALAVVGLFAGSMASARGETDLARSEAVVTRLSATFEGFLVRPRNAWFPVPPPAPPEMGDAAGLFPGFALLILAGLGLLAGPREGRGRRWPVFFALTAIGSALLAAGPGLRPGGWSPYLALRDVVPFLAEIRSPYRWTLLTQVALVPLAARGLTDLAGAWRGWRIALGMALGLAAAAENLPLPSQPAPLPASAPWESWLAGRGDDPVVAHLPLPTGFHVSDYEREARRMVAQVHHGRRMINGYTSAFPESYTRLQVTLQSEGVAAAMPCVLRRVFGADLLVADRGWVETGAGAALRGPELASQLPLEYEDADVLVYRIAPDPVTCR